jgi:hypothetical protein
VLFQAIAFRPYTLPPGSKISSVAQDLMVQLMRKDPLHRLKTFSEFKQHPFFERVAKAGCTSGAPDQWEQWWEQVNSVKQAKRTQSEPDQWKQWWEHIVRKQVTAPYTPAISSATDVSMYTKYLANDLRLSTVLNANGRMVGKDGLTLAPALPKLESVDEASGLDEDEDDEFLSWIYDAGNTGQKGT